MLKGAFIFFGAAIITGLFGFSGAAGTAAGMVQISFIIFITLFLIALLFGALVTL